jgi:hypothetical protein
MSLLETALKIGSLTSRSIKDLSLSLKTNILILGEMTAHSPTDSNTT